MSNILSIQSAVSYGHVGNSAAVFPLQRIGHEVWPVYTVNYSNHTGYGSWKGPMIPATEVAAIIDGIEERGALPRVDAILSGYQGGDDIADLDSPLCAVDAAREMGPSTVLVTSVERADAPADTIEMIAVDDHGKWIVRTPRLPFKRNGSGDVTAALFTGHYLRGGNAADALAKTASSVYDLLKRTYDADSAELLLVESQDAYANPQLQFEVEAL